MPSALQQNLRGRELLDRAKGDSGKSGGAGALREAGLVVVARRAQLRPRRLGGQVPGVLAEPCAARGQQACEWGRFARDEREVRSRRGRKRDLAPVGRVRQDFQRVRVDEPVFTEPTDTYLPRA